MRVIEIDNACTGILIGIREENGYRQIAYTYPDDWSGLITAFIKRPGEESAVPLTGLVDSDGVATVTLSDSDLRSAGRGQLEFMFSDGETVGKSKVFPVLIADDIISDSVESEDDFESWINELVQAGAIAKKYAEDSLRYAVQSSNAATAAYNYEQGAKNWQILAYNARNEAVSAKEGAEEAADKAEQAAANAGFMWFYINSSGELIMERTENVDSIDFYLSNGDLFMVVD